MVTLGNEPWAAIIYLVSKNLLNHLLELTSLFPNPLYNIMKLLALSPMFRINTCLSVICLQSAVNEGLMNEVLKRTEICEN